jgi:hypothetical protein
MNPTPRDSIDLTTPSTIENVDFALFDYMDQVLNLSCETKEGLKKVPVIWVTPERAFQIKNNKEMRDENGALILPLMTIERTGLAQDMKSYGAYYNSIPPYKNRIQISRKINQVKTAKFANANTLRTTGQINFLTSKNNKKIVYETKTVLLPVYATFEYTISIITQFAQQMNEIIQPFLTKNGSIKYFMIERDGYKYESYIESYEQDNNLSNLEGEERKYITKVKLKVLANMNSDGVNQEDALVRKTENAVDIHLGRESLIIAGEKKELQERKIRNVGVTATYSGVASKKVFLIGDGVNSQYTITHNMNSRDLMVRIRETNAPYDTIEAGVGYEDLNNIIVDVGDAIPNDKYTVIIFA